MRADDKEQGLLWLTDPLEFLCNRSRFSGEIMHSEGVGIRSSFEFESAFELLVLSV